MWLTPGRKKSERCKATSSATDVAETSIRSFTDTGKRQFLCLVCHQRFRRKADLERHGLVHKDTPPMHRCDEKGCPRALESKGFHRRDNLHQHIRNKHKRDPKTVSCRDGEKAIGQGPEPTTSDAAPVVPQKRAREPDPASMTFEDLFEAFLQSQDERQHLGRLLASERAARQRQEEEWRLERRRYERREDYYLVCLEKSIKT